jgi:hypothetical protein
MEKDPEFYRRISDIEQISTTLSAVANILSAYFKSLCDAGFSRKDALKLTISYQEILLKNALEATTENNLMYDEDDEDDEIEGDDSEYSSN